MPERVDSSWWGSEPEEHHAENEGNGHEGETNEQTFE